MVLTGQATILPHAFTAGTLHDPAHGAWNMDTVLRPLSRYKACLVANGSTQLEGVDVDETFSPFVKQGTIWTVLSLVTSRHWSIHQLDVKNAFLHGDLSKTIYMHHPPGFQDSVHPNYIIISLHQEFAMTDLGPLNYFLGISVTRDSSGLFLSQKKYTIEILDKAHMDNCNPSRTPIYTESKLGSDDEGEGTEGLLIIEAEIREIKNQLVPATAPLIGFNGEIIWPIGKIQLLVRIEDEEHSALAWMNFMVVRSSSSYNIIIGRPGVKKLQAVPSTTHGMLKIHVE
nr:hypothetical protein [Tanacetum cinerariifolium]